MVLLVVMPCDNYVTICWPLHGMTIMNHDTWSLLVEVGFLPLTVQILISFWLPCCGPEIMYHFMCDIFPLIQLPTPAPKLSLGHCNGGVTHVISFIMLVFSVLILCALRIQSFVGRKESTLLGSSSQFFLTLCASNFIYLCPVATFPWRSYISIYYFSYTHEIQ